MSRSTSAQYIFHKNYLYCVLEAFLRKVYPARVISGRVYIFFTAANNLYIQS